MRCHLPGWTGNDMDTIESQLSGVKGIERVQANPLTGNILIRFDRCSTGEKELQAGVQRVWEGLRAARAPFQAAGTVPPGGDGLGQPAASRGPRKSPVI